MGFVLVFAIIIGSVGLLYVTGFQAMEDYQEGEQIHNAERAMDALADNFNDVMRYDAIEERSGELALRDGTISTGDGGAELEVDGEFDGEKVPIGSLEYQLGSEVVAYEGGGIFRHSDDGEGSVALREPRMSCGENTGLISLVVIEPTDRSLQSSGSLELTVTEQESIRKTVEENDAVEITITGESSTSQVWEDVLDPEDENKQWEFEDDTYTCDADKVTIDIVVVDIDY
ncbi:DUF7289 family protein [Natrononativus amylolyticus]|uniref:DUF7289 family protein n=1 Tax=Natrononativus amylolyticus TaxID=2963434 RepID=UPI0020CD9797|nr:hypothetical protein [Natrononativus amylolyticus]